MRTTEKTGVMRPRPIRAASFSVWRLADMGVGAVVGLICVGFSYGFLDGVPVWWHAAMWLVGFLITVLFARPLSTSM